MKRFLVLLLLILPINVIAADSSDVKLNKMYKYICGELIEVQKQLDVIMQQQVEPLPLPPSDNVPILKSGHKGFYNLRSKEIKLFKFTGKVSNPACPIQVGNTSMPQQPRTVHLLVKRGKKPTVGEFKRTWGRPPSQYDARAKKWIPSKGGVKNLYWKYNTGSQGEFIEIAEPMKANTFYIMLYNSGSRLVRNQRLTMKVY